MIKAISILFLASILSFNAYAAPDFEAKVKASMGALKDKLGKIGPASIKGEEVAGEKRVPGLYFGAVKVNGNFEVVDAIKSEHGGTATLFVKSGEEFVRVTTNVQKDDGTRAVGTILDPKGKAIAAIKEGKPFYGVVEILGKPYNTGYEPIYDASKNIIGVYYVGYLKLN